jgi:tetratricopeptide (TPR) repeat protein
MFQRENVSPLFAVLAASLLILTASIGAPDVFAAQENAQDYLQKGVDELSKGDAERALREIEKAIEVAPGYPAAHFYAGMALAQMQKFEDAYDYFVAAADLSPGYAEAHMRACMVAYHQGKYDDSWEQAILASQAGYDMSQAFVGLEQEKAPPSDFEQRLNAPRVVIGGFDLEALSARDAFMGPPTEDVPSRSADAGTNAADSTQTSGLPLGTGSTGAGLVAEASPELNEVRRQFGILLSQSKSFAVVPRPELADFMMEIQVDQLSEVEPRAMKGIIKLIEYSTLEQVYSRPVKFRNIASVADLRTDVSRFVGYMETWLSEQEGR